MATEMKKPIVAIGQNGDMIGYFDSIEDAYGHYELDIHELEHACRTSCFYGGVRWMFAKDFEEYYKECRTTELAYNSTSGTRLAKRAIFLPYKYADINRVVEMSDKKSHGNCKPTRIICYNNGIAYKSIDMVAADLGVTKSDITGALKNGRPIKRKYWIHEMREDDYLHYIDIAKRREKYVAIPKYRIYAIYTWTEDDKGILRCRPTYEIFFDREEALKRCYELNENLNI